MKLSREDKPTAPVMPSEGELLQDIAKRITGAIADNLVEIGAQARKQAAELIPGIIAAGLGIKRDSWGNHRSDESASFEFMRSNGFHGLLQDYVKAEASRTAAEKIDEAMDAILTELKTKDGKWKPGFLKVIRQTYLEEYRRYLREALVARMKNIGESDRTNAFTKIVNDSIGNLRVMHEDRLKAMITAAREAEESAYVQRRNRQ